MKNIKTILVLLLLNFSIQHSLAQKDIYAGQLSSAELTDLKSYLKNHTATDLDSISILTINYLQPSSYCHYSKYNFNIKDGDSWFLNYFKENNVKFPKNSKFTNIYYEEFGNRKLTPALNYYFDKNHFLYNLLRSKDKRRSCECFIMINKEGKIRIKYGEILGHEIRQFVQEIIE